VVVCGNSFYDIFQCNGAIARTTTILFGGGAKSTRRKQQNTECRPIFSVFKFMITLPWTAGVGGLQTKAQ
jgi:hypothetical protein